MLEDTSFISFIFTTIGWFVFSYMYISIGEHQIHKRLMHSRCLPESIYKAYPYVLDTFEAHGVRHHTQWYREFDYEPDDYGRSENLIIPLKEGLLMLLVSSPLWVPIFFISVYGGCIFLITDFIHNRLWSVLHTQMHIPKDVYYKDWALYRFIARNHFMHHQNTAGNLNVAFPFADFVFGTRTKPAPKDIREMLRLGYLKPKSDKGLALVDKWREATATLRAQTT